MGKSKIPYLDKVINVHVGCSGKGCSAQCWARDLHNKRHKAFLEGKKMPKQYAKPFNEVQFLPERLQEALHRKKPTVYGVSFTGDMFDKQVPWEWQRQILNQCRDERCLRHQFIFLTKQTGTMERVVSKWVKGTQDVYACLNLDEKDITSNMWFGTTVCTQAEADERIPELLKVPGHIWVSYEPGIERVNFRPFVDHRCGNCQRDTRECKTGPGICFDRKPIYERRINALVVGCESGPKRRPMNLDWVRDAVEVCRYEHVPVYVKQLDINGKVSTNPEEWPEELRVQQLPWRNERACCGGN